MQRVYTATSLILFADYLGCSGSIISTEMSGLSTPPVSSSPHFPPFSPLSAERPFETHPELYVAPLARLVGPAERAAARSRNRFRLHFRSQKSAAAAGDVNYL